MLTGHFTDDLKRPRTTSDDLKWPQIVLARDRVDDLLRVTLLYYRVIGFKLIVHQTNNFSWLSFSLQNVIFKILKGKFDINIQFSFFHDLVITIFKYLKNPASFQSDFLRPYVLLLWISSGCGHQVRLVKSRVIFQV